VTPMATTVADR